MKRRVERELLDHLPPEDPFAIRSRRDLQRLNRLMGHARLASRLLRRTGPAPGRIIELGAGDGRFALALAAKLSQQWRPAEIVLVDRLSLVSKPTLAAFRERGWTARSVEADAFAWFAANRDTGGCVVTNLFLHHFDDARLRELLALIAETANCLAACEPRRSAIVLAASRMIGLIGCNAVTRHDAAVSVRAGFRRQELSQLWPAGNSWSRDESPGGLFSHCFLARRSTLRR